MVGIDFYPLRQTIQKLSKDVIYQMDRGQLLKAMRDLEWDILKIEGENRELEESIEKLSPDERYIVVDTNRGRLLLKQGNTILRETICSTGSGAELEGPEGQKWIFNTPKGTFEVLGKYKDPIWTKPDWAFVEEDEPIPPTLSPERVKEAVLGRYALHFGDGYFIHGTLYTRLLGENVTHGCVRLGDDDLEIVYDASPVGTKIYIF